MIRTTTWLAFAAALVLCACASTPTPDAAVARHLEEVNRILTTNMTSPVDGLRRLREYGRENLPDFAAQVAKAMVELDRIGDPVARQDRAREMMAKLERPLAELAATSARFDEAASRSEAASDYARDLAATSEQVASLIAALDLRRATRGPLADEALCRAAYATMCRLTIDETIANLTDFDDDLKAEARKRAEESLQGRDGAFVAGCVKERRELVECMAAATSMVEFEGCTRD
ncbi:MAG: hypothetical protein H6745_06855 [Deltaproteobacteria bacterium]|nr:hypothetical protein [Deltaproteobacteria bacterium]